MKTDDDIIARYWQKRLERRVAQKVLRSLEGARDVVGIMAQARRVHTLDGEVEALAWVIGPDAERMLGDMLDALEQPRALRLDALTGAGLSPSGGDDAA